MIVSWSHRFWKSFILIGVFFEILHRLTRYGSPELINLLLLVSRSRLFIERLAIVFSVCISIKICSCVYPHIETLLLLENTVAQLNLLYCGIYTRFLVIFNVDLLRISDVSSRRKWVASSWCQMIPVVVFYRFTVTIVAISFRLFWLVHIWTRLRVIWHRLRLATIKLITSRTSVHLNWVMCLFALFLLPSFLSFILNAL